MTFTLLNVMCMHMHMVMDTHTETNLDRSTDMDMGTDMDVGKRCAWTWTRTPGMNLTRRNGLFIKQS
jgi:hypothetical protein